MRSRILFLSGRQEDAPILARMLQGLPVLFETAEDLRQARARLLQDEYQLIVAEAALADGNWLNVLHLVRECPYEAQVILASTDVDPGLWADAMNLGVYDVLAQPWYEPEVRRIVSNACAHRHHWARPAAAAMAAI